ncbi:sugar ABC transporter permease [Neobacillus sp. OS1-32]|jgi:multiple sugar transport system permease protein|uniref:ABC transporter permease subunit n=1 Tax=Neobacillus paridis TaxID=2803862 RepID=A0ABS1TSH6_9BACI|nr:MULTISPECIES: sugar ABC transporter permease [Neobacillus]MBL4953518.1 ABC transporter permease subunit [Neobacillus paridis]WML29163.1 sugar ABC transporter permease [Neobacillus sp. OS1-32]
MRKMGVKEWLLIVPTLLLIAIFSLWPVVQSFTYTFFDYRLNNQQKAGLYLSERFNASLFNETQMYLTMFLDEDLPNIKAAGDQDRVASLNKDLSSVAQKYKNEKGVIKINKQEKTSIEQLHKNAKELVTSLNQKYKLIHKDDLPHVVNDLQKCVIPSNFIGLQGYKQALSDTRVGIALGNTLVFTIISVFLELVLGLGLALVLNKAMFGQGMIRTTSLIPWAIPTAVAALMWSYLFNGSSGIIAHLFEMVGLVDKSQDLLLSGSGAMASTILADVWKTTPYMALLLLAGLQNISKDLYEAASIDGATKIQSFFKVTLPLLKPSILVALLFRTLDAFRVFDLIYVLTGGGPGGETETMSIYAYKVMFGQTNFGYGSIIVMLMFVCVAIIAIIFVKFLGANLMERS